jgi:ubiquinone/menaquinone biosynthesis C-methylase UbiE
MAPINMRAAWNQIAASYQKLHTLPTDSAHYGPWAPLENQLRLLGDVTGRRILEIGCGGGQCSIAFARQGATAAGIDLSDAQLDYARQLARQEEVTINFVQGAADDLSSFKDGDWEIVFSTYAFHYVADIARALSECARVLCSHGRLVFSLDHPFHDCFFDIEENDLTPYPVRSYFNHDAMTWAFAETGVWMRSYHHTIGEWLDMLNHAGFRLVRLLEPSPPVELLDEIWPDDDPRAALRNLPQTIIFVAEKIT